MHSLGGLIDASNVDGVLRIDMILRRSSQMVPACKVESNDVGKGAKL